MSITPHSSIHFDPTLGLSPYPQCIDVCLYKNRPNNTKHIDIKRFKHALAMVMHYAYLPTLFLCGTLNYSPAFSAEPADKLYDMPLDQLVNVEVVSASRFKQKSSEAPSAVDVVTAKDIQHYGWRTLSDALNALRGLYVRNDRSYSYLGNRGFSHTGDYNSRVLFMIDGRRMNDAVYDQGFIGEEFMVDMNLIERIEYIPGSGSSVYGANALLGVINVITKQGKDINGLKVSGEVGSLNMYRTRATYGKQWSNGTDLLINASRYFSHGQDQLYFPEFKSENGGIAQDMDQERSSKVFGKLTYGDFTLRGGYVNRYKHVPTASFGATFNDPRYFTIDQQAYLDLDYITQINTDLDLEVRGFHHWSLYDQNEPMAAGTLLGTENSRARWWGGEIKFTGTQFEHNKWVAGLEIQHDNQQQSNHDIGASEDNLNVSRTGWRAGMYVQDEYHITDSLLLNVGLRLDYHHMIKKLQLNPRIGLIWDVSPTFTTKLLYSSAFRAPNAFERDYSLKDSPSYRNNPNNTEELIKSYEAIAEWRPGGGLKLLGTFFYNDMKDVLEKNTTKSNLKNPYGMYNNTGRYQTYGFEFGAEKRWDNGRQLKLSWTYNHTSDQQDNWAQNSPQNLVKLHYAEPFFNDNVLLGIEEIFVDQRRTINKSNQANNIAPAYNLLNINLSLAKPFYGFQPSLGIYNVLDQRFEVLGSNEHEQNTLEMDGRSVRFRLEYGF